MADAEGYRQNADAPASNEILRSIIFNKLPLLNSPGELIPNTLYYDARNCSVQAAEQTNFFGRDRITFNSKAFGSPPSVHIPNVFFTNTCFVIMELDVEALKWKNTELGAGEKAQFYMPHGWGFCAIDNIVYYLGSSSVANIQISGVGNYIWHMATCETHSKKQQMLTGAGQLLCPTVHAYDNHDFGIVESEMDGFRVGNFVFANKGTGQTVWYPRDPPVGDPLVTEAGWRYVPIQKPYFPMAMAVVPIRLPFSSMAALEKRISFDTKLLQQPIQLTLGLKNLEQFSCIRRDQLQDSQAFYTGFKSLTFQSFQQGLSDQSLSLRNELLANPRFSVGIPFQYIQDMKFNILAEQNGKYFVNITSMLNADLTTIQFALQWDQDQKSPIANDSTQTRFCPLAFIKMYNIELLLNGQRLHNYDGDSFPFVYLSNTLSEYWSHVTSAPPEPESATSTTLYSRKNTVPIQSCVYEINFSRLRAAAAEAHMMNTPRFTNQTMQLAFTLWPYRPDFYPSQIETPAPVGGAPVVFGKDKPLTLMLHTSYYYNAVFMVGQDGGQSKLITA